MQLKQEEYSSQILISFAQSSWRNLKIRGRSRYVFKISFLPFYHKLYQSF
nr:MAG TPA: hypothetical protein [Caudoviricetes sp.]